MMYLDFPTVAFNIEAHVGFALAVRGIQLGDHLLWLYTRVLREHSDGKEFRLKLQSNSCNQLYTSQKTYDSCEIIITITI